MHYLISVSKRDLLNMRYLYFIGAAGVKIRSGSRKLPERFSEIPAGRYQEPSDSKANVLYSKNFITQHISYVYDICIYIYSIYILYIVSTYIVFIEKIVVKSS